MNDYRIDEVVIPEQHFLFPGKFQGKPVHIHLFQGSPDGYKAFRHGPGHSTHIFSCAAFTSLVVDRYDRSMTVYA
jgi:hypothetical protein